MRTYNRDWPQVLNQAREAIRLYQISSWGILAKKLNIPRKTLQEAFFREFHIDFFEQIAETVIQPPPEILEISQSDEESIIYSQEDDDTITVESKSSRIKTLEQLIDVCKVDIEKWKVEKFVVNKWEVGAKDDNGNIVIEPLFQVKAWLIPKISPAHIIQPITINISPVTKRRPPVPQDEFTANAIQSALIIPDLHFGFIRDFNTGKIMPIHDRRALSVVQQIACKFTFNKVVYTGDILDLADWSDKFIKSPEFYWGTQAAIIEAAWFLNQIKLCLPEAEHTAMIGNHDLRMEKAVITHLNSAYHLRPANAVDKKPSLSIEKLLDLEEMGINCISEYLDGEVWINDKIRCIHGDIARNNTGDTAKAIIAKTNYTTIFGHIHRTELATRTIRGRDKPRVIYAFSPGCLCHVDGRVPGANKDRQWQQGIGVIHYNADNISITPIPIESGKSIYAGINFESEDYTDQLVKDTNWKFDPDY